MSDLSWLAPTIAALSALVVAIIGALRSQSNGAKADAVAAKVEVVLEKATEIHSTTNGTLTAANSATAAATALKDVMLERVEGLERALAEMRKSGALAAATAEQAATDVRAAQAVMPPDTGGKPPGE